MKKLIVYHSIDEKAKWEQELFKPMKPTDAMIQALEYLDLLSAMSRPRPVDNDHPWILLEINKAASDQQ